MTATNPLSLLDIELEVYNQNSFLFSGKDNPLNFIIAINYLMSNFKVDRWFNIGVIFDLFRNNYLLDDIFFIGVYSDIDTNLQGINNFNYYFRIKKELTKKILISLSTKYNSIYKESNHNLELTIKI